MSQTLQPGDIVFLRPRSDKRRHITAVFRGYSHRGKKARVQPAGHKHDELLPIDWVRPAKAENFRLRQMMGKA